VRLGGYLDKHEAAELIGWSDFLLLPSRVESIPVIFSDAMQLGTPLISTPVGDLPRLHEKFEFGALANSATSEDFAVAIRSAINTTPEAFANSVKNASAEFDLASIVTQFLDQTGIGTHG
jgi:glycosyltransferase involved in cell wall biosynthesis